MKLDVVAVAAGLLHDVVEDTLTTPERIAELFGDEIAHVVEGVTKIGAIPFSSSEERQAENFRKMLLAMVDDIRVILVKLADRLHNMRTLHHLPEERRIKIAQETLDIYAPIANRLGHEQGEERARGAVVQGTRAEGVRRPPRQGRGAAEERRRRHRRPDRSDLRAKLEEAQVPVIALDGRIKRLYSIHLKLKRQKIDLERVYDFVALRVITQSVKDCYAALGIIHQTWSPVPGRIKDFIAMPRPNGYQSLHTSVISEHGFPFEVQIRTEEMHRRAEEGIAAHWKYKEGRVGDQPRRAVLPVDAAAARGAAGGPRSAGVPSEPEDRPLPGGGLHLHAERARCGRCRAARRPWISPTAFTPTSATSASARASTARWCRCARRLQNGDIVEIITQAGHKPSRDWLTFVVTVARAQQDQARAPGRGTGAQHRAWTPAVRKGGAALRSQPEDACSRARSSRSSPRSTARRSPTSCSRTSATASCRRARCCRRPCPGGQLKEKLPDSAVVSVVKRVLRPGRVGQDQSPRDRRRHGVPGQVLQPDPR